MKIGKEVSFEASFFFGRPTVETQNIASPHVLTDARHCVSTCIDRRKILRLYNSHLHELTVIDCPIDSLLAQEFIMRPLLHHLAGVQHDDLVRIHDSA